MIKIFTYLDQGCEPCKHVLNNLKQIENWKNYFEIVDICVDSSKEVKSTQESAFSEQALKYNITQGPTIVIVDGDNFSIENVKSDSMSEDYLRSLIDQ
jgi:hypothetical protein